VKYTVKEVDGAEEDETINALHKLCLPHDELPSVHDGWWWLAYANDVAVGYACMRDAKSEENAAFLAIAGVVPEHRGKGLQRRLIRVRVQKARRLMKRAVISYTMDNAPSGNNLIACGFRLYDPDKRWEGGDVTYWRRQFT
jgi:GNAT superfamily N-acetyltransferase